MSWDTVKLGDACDVVAGGTPKRSIDRYWEGDVPWVKISDMLQGRIKHTDEMITTAGLENSTAKLLPAGTLLISIFATIGRTATLSIDATTNQAIVGVIPKRKGIFDKRFLEYSLQHKTVELKRQARGVAQANINGSVLKATALPLPPLAEQKRIAGILDAADALRAKRRAALAQLDSLLQSTFLDMFGDPVTNPKGWGVSTLGAECLEIKNGRSVKQTKGAGGIPISRIETIAEGTVNPNKVGYAGLDLAEAEKHLLQPGDILFSHINSSAHLCKCAIYRQQHGMLMHGMNLLRLRPGPRIDPFFLLYLIKSVPYRELLMRLENPSVNQSSIAGGKLKVQEVAVPDLSLQRRFAGYVEAIERQKARQQSHLAELDTLFASLQARAFRGDL